MGYSLHRCRKILRHACSLYRRKGKRLPERERAFLEEDLENLDTFILQKNVILAAPLAQKVEKKTKEYFPKRLSDQVREIVFALIFAIVLAFLIRQFWFELYEVPTGSMRPTIEEKDRLIVSKTTFGIHFPFQKNLFFFRPEYVQRTGIFVFTVRDMDVSDADTMYFYVFPGKKRFIKRCLGKAGDTLYFYGGRIYGVDKEGNPIQEMSDQQFLDNIGIGRIESIPYISFDGKIAASSPIAPSVFAEATLRQMNQPVGKLRLGQEGAIAGQFFNGKEWVDDRPNSLKEAHDTPQSYSDLWGIGNYAMARLLTKEELAKIYPDSLPASQEDLLYLDLKHTPNLTYPSPEMRRDETGKAHPMITPFSTLIPLQKRHLENIQKNLYTARFYVKNGRAYRYQEGGGRPQRTEFDPLFPQVPDGCYEFYYGKGYKVHFGGIMTALPSNHPLYNSSPENIQKLFNLGLLFNIIFQPYAGNQPFNPPRYAYYRDGDLYVMGAPVIKKEDPTLVAFVKKELEKQKRSSEARPYIAFVDHGAPLKEGEINRAFIEAFGLKIPEQSYLALGDNHAMSADSRDFGFVPESNLRGAPALTFWPPSKRFGFLPQPAYPFWTIPNVIIWTLVLIVIAATLFYIRWRNRQPCFKKRRLE